MPLLFNAVAQVRKQLQHHAARNVVDPRGAVLARFAGLHDCTAITLWNRRLFCSLILRSAFFRDVALPSGPYTMSSASFTKRLIASCINAQNTFLNAFCFGLSCRFVVLRVVLCSVLAIDRSSR